MGETNQLSDVATLGCGQEVYFDVVEAADFLNVSRAELLRRVDSGVMPGHKLWHGKRFCWKFKRSELESELRRRNGELQESQIQ